MTVLEYYNKINNTSIEATHAAHASPPPKTSTTKCAENIKTVIKKYYNYLQQAPLEGAAHSARLCPYCNKLKSLVTFADVGYIVCRTCYKERRRVFQIRENNWREAQKIKKEMFIRNKLKKQKRKEWGDLYLANEKYKKLMSA